MGVARTDGRPGDTGLGKLRAGEREGHEHSTATLCVLLVKDGSRHGRQRDSRPRYLILIISVLAVAAL